MNNYSRGFLYFICAVSAMGGLLFGYDWVVIGGAKPFYELYFGISDSPLLQGVAMSTALVGCLIGAMVAGAAADKYGRKPLLIVAAVLFTVSAIATGLFNDFTLFNIARFIGGMRTNGLAEPDDHRTGYPCCAGGKYAAGERYVCGRKSGMESGVGVALDVLG